MEANTILPSGATPLAYRLRLAPNLDDCTYTFDVDLSLKLPPSTTSVTLHWIPKKDLPPIQSAIFCRDEDITTDNFSSCGIAGVQCASFQTSTKVTLDPELQTIQFDFPNMLPENVGRIFISGASTLDDSLCGLYRSAYVDPHTGKKKYMAVTQFEATDARRCFPCIDEPSAKATFQLSVVRNVSRLFSI
jgi:aminopeptidase N